MGPFQCWMMVYASVLSMRCHPRQIASFNASECQEAIEFAASVATASVGFIEKEFSWASEQRSEVPSN